MTMELKVILLVVCAAIIVECRPQDNAIDPIIRNDFTLDSEGNFQFRVDTNDGFHHDAIGYSDLTDTEEGSQVVKGSYSYTGPDGTVHQVTYIADKDGFRANVTHTAFSLLSAPVGSDCIGSLCGTGLG